MTGAECATARLQVAATRRVFLFLVFTISFTLPASGFTHINIALSSKQYLERTAASAKSKKDDSSAEPGPLESRKNGERLRRRVDYPSFAYTTNRQSASRPKPRIKFRVIKKNKDSDEVVQRSMTETRVPRSVSIPGGKPEKEQFSLQSIFDALTNATSSNSAFSTESVGIFDEAKRTRLLNYRAYARKEPFAAANVPEPPSLADLSPPSTNLRYRIWITSPFRVATFLAAAFSLPYITSFLERFVSTDQVDAIVSMFGPGVSILYGTFVSLTLSILYTRQQEIQRNAATESSLLTLITRNMLNLFRHDKELAIEAGQCSADQIRTLVRGSRGGELMLLMYSDPYARMSELVDFFEDRAIQQGQFDLRGKAGLVGTTRDILKDLNKLRASRLSDEALALPPTHFVILTVLTLLILLGYVLSTLPTVDVATGAPSNESSVLFGTLCTIYVLFYNFAKDLNDPFQGVYQLRRSSIATHLLEAKWLIANHPLLRGEVDFEEIEEESNGDLIIRSPGLGDLRFEREEIFPDAAGQEETED